MAAADVTTTKTTEQTLPKVPLLTAHSVEQEVTGWRSWVLTTDHKKIGIMYIVAALVFFVLGGVEALLIRLQLGTPDNTLLDPQTYNAMFTMHGTTMVFLFVIPIMAGFGNYFAPLQIGARDMAFPKLNGLSFWFYMAGGVVFYSSLFFGAPEAAWTTYAPLSDDAYTPGFGTDAWIFLVHLTGISSLVGAVNFVVTIANMRAPGMGWGRMPIFVWTILIYSVMLIIALPVIAVGATLLLTDRHFGTNFYDVTGGGDPLLWQHLFWFFGHPEVYIMIIPGFGIISEVLPVFSRKPIFGYKAVAAATASIAFLGTLVWAHHMFTTPSPTAVLVFFMIGSFLIGVPTGVKIFNWIFTLYQGAIEFKTPLLFAVGFLSMFLIGGISGIVLATFPIDWQLHDSYFVVAHFHYVLVGGAMFSIASGIYYWYPKMTGRMMSETLGKWSFWFMFVGFNITFLIQHSLGLDGMPRRIYEYGDIGNWGTWNLISTIGSFVLGIGLLLSFINGYRSLKNGAIAGPDPWRGNTLEWFIPSPPPVNNFDVVPTVRSVEPLKDIRQEVASRSGAAEAAPEPAAH
ncbi:MAG: cytochrome c oxidase subunit I [Solirubrobacteraceae bacterium]|nr:cytochrome c oxidase subunit I [Solirubrobacteraceae bacterium]